MFTNPFLEGLILALAGVVAIGVGSWLKAPELSDAGKLLLGAGVGYFSHTAVSSK